MKSEMHEFVRYDRVMMRVVLKFKTSFIGGYHYAGTRRSEISAIIRKAYFDEYGERLSVDCSVMDTPYVIKSLSRRGMIKHDNGSWYMTFKGYAWAKEVLRS